MCYILSPNFYCIKVNANNISSDIIYRVTKEIIIIVLEISTNVQTSDYSFLLLKFIPIT